MSKKKSLVLYSILFGVIFIIIPFGLFRFTSIFKDFGFYFLYAVFIFPFILAVFLSIFVKKFKNKVDNYKRIILYGNTRDIKQNSRN